MVKARSSKARATSSVSNGKAFVVSPNCSPIAVEPNTKDADLGAVPPFPLRGSSPAEDKAEPSSKRTKKKSPAVVSPAPKRKKRDAVVVDLTAAASSSKQAPKKSSPKKGSSTTQKVAAKATPSKKAAAPQKSKGKAPAKIPHKKSITPKKHRRRSAVFSAVAAAGATALCSQMLVDWNVNRTAHSRAAVTDNAAGAVVAPTAAATVRKAQEVVIKTMNQTAAWGSHLLPHPKDKSEDVDASSRAPVSTFGVKRAQDVVMQTVNQTAAWGSNLLPRPKDKSEDMDMNRAEEEAVGSLRGTVIEESVLKRERIRGLRMLNKKIKGFGQFLKDIVEEDSDFLYL